MKDEEAGEPEWRAHQAQGVPRRKNGIRGTGDREIHLGGHQTDDRMLVEVTEGSRLALGSEIEDGKFVTGEN